MAWLYEPCAYSTATEDSSLGSSSPSDSTEYEPWLVLSGTATRRPYSWRGWKNRPWIRLLYGTTLRPSMAQRGVDVLTSSLRDSHASLGPLPVSERELTTIAGSGRRSSGSSVTWDRASSSWRTSPGSTLPGLPVEDFRTSSRVLPTSGSMRNGVCSQRPTLVPPTSATASGSWPTPTTKDTNLVWSPVHESHGMELRRAVGHFHERMWQTPTTTEAEGNGMRSGSRSGEPKLQGQAKMWPTPRASMNENRTTKPAPSHGVSHGSTLAGEASRHAPTTATDGPDGSPRADLNPPFVAALMGVPWGWLTPSTLEATDWCHWQQHMPSLNLQLDLGS